MADEQVDYLTPEESDNRLAWIHFTVLEDFWSTPQTESAGKVAFSGADKPQRYWKVRVDDVLQDWESEVPEEIMLQFSIGDKWYITDEGNVRHLEDVEGGKPHLFKNSSTFGQVLALITGQRSQYIAEKVVVLDNGPEDVEYDMTGARKALLDAEHGDPREPGIFTGFQFESRGLGLKYRTRPGEEERQLRSKPLPTRFLGVDGGVESASPVSGKVSSEVSVEDVAGLLQGNADADEDTVNSLTELLNKASSQSSFKRNALALAGDNEGLKAAIMSGGLWSLKDA